MAAQPESFDAYEILGVHPSAPIELIGAMYWTSAGDFQRRRLGGENIDAELHALTRAYELVSDADRRARYDELNGTAAEPVITRSIPVPRRSIIDTIRRRRVAAPNVDYYEILGLTPSATAPRAREAHRIMRDIYLRAPNPQKRTRLVALLDDALAMMLEPERREQYDQGRRKGNRAAIPPATVVAPLAAAQEEPIADMPSVSELAADDPPITETEDPGMDQESGEATVTEIPERAGVGDMAEEVTVAEQETADPLPEPARPAEPAVVVETATPVIAREGTGPPSEPPKDVPVRVNPFSKGARALAGGAGALVAAGALGIKSSYRAVAQRTSGSRNDDANGSTLPAAQPQPGTARTQSSNPRPKDVEEVFLGRLASTVEQTEQGDSGRET
jgi:hypothetical protein